MLTEVQLKELERRCDAALKCQTLREQMDIMGNYWNADHTELPPAIQAKFCKVLSSMASRTFTR